MKKASLVLALGLMVVILTGCGNAESATSVTSSPAAENKNKSTSSAASTVSAESCEDISYAAMIPDIQSSFPSGKLNVVDEDGGSGYTVNVTGCTDDEYKKYIEGCKSKGFNDVTINIEQDDYGKIEAHSEDGKYYVSLQFFKDKGELNVTCGKRRNAG